MHFPAILILEFLGKSGTTLVMRALYRLSLFIAVVWFAGVSAHAQAEPSAYRYEGALFGGVEYSNYHASFPYASGIRMSGIGGFADWNFVGGHIGVEGAARFLRWGGFYDTNESSYLAGPRYLFPSWHRLQPYGKVLVGLGRINYPFQIGSASYFAVAPGGGVNYRFSSRWTVRADYEFQWWLNSPGYANQPNHGFTPNGVSIGVAYRFFPR